MGFFVKCKCQHCNQNIEFDEVHAGERINCPSCGMETQLYIPQYHPPERDTSSTKTHGVFYYVFWGVISLIGTVFILLFVCMVVGIGLPAFLQARKQAQNPELVKISFTPEQLLVASNLNSKFPSRFAKTYDKFYDSISIEPSEPLTINRLSIAPVAYASQGEMPSSIYLRMDSQNEGWRFLKYSRFIILFDGQKKDLGELKDDGDVLDGGRVFERLNAKFSVDEFRQIAFAKSVEARIGAEDFTFDYDSRSDWRLLAMYCSEK